MQRVQAKKVLSAFRQGSSWPVIVDAGARRVFTKLHATAHGTAPLVAEIVVGELADALGIATPARCLVELEAGIESLDPRQPGSFVEQHLLRVSPRELDDCDAELAPKVTRELLEHALAAVPDEFMLPLAAAGRDALRLRAAYVAFLWKRVRAPRPFVNPGRKTPFQS